MKLTDISKEWFGNAPKDLVAGAVVALALIPEAIAFSIIAGVDPQVGLYASFCIAVVTAFLGGRSGMISAATGAMALLMIGLVKNHGLEYLLVATIATGLVQMLCGWLKLGEVLRFVSSSVMTGFINALAVLIFLAQLPEFNGAGWQMFVMVGVGLAIIYLFPRVTKTVPSPLVCIVMVTLFSLLPGMDLRTVGDMGHLPSTLPIFLLPQIPLNLETIGIIAPYVLALFPPARQRSSPPVGYLTWIPSLHEDDGIGARSFRQGSTSRSQQTLPLLVRQVAKTIYD